MGKDTHLANVWNMHRQKLRLEPDAAGELPRANERDRMHALFDITQALVSELRPAELFSAISERLRPVINHASGSLCLLDKATGKLHVAGVESPQAGELRVDEEDRTFSPEGLPNAEAMRS